VSLQGSPPIIRAGGVPLDPKRILSGLTITVGRSDPSVQPEANTMTLEYRGVPDLSAGFSIGGEIGMSVEAPIGWWGEPNTGYLWGGDLWLDDWSNPATAPGPPVNAPNVLGDDAASTPGRWRTPGYGYAFPAYTALVAEPGGGVRITWNETPAQAAGGYGMAMVDSPTALVAGHIYLLEIVVERLALGDSVLRATQAYHRSGAWCPDTIGTHTLHLDFMYEDGSPASFGVEASAVGNGLKGEAVVRSIRLLDLTEHPAGDQPVSRFVGTVTDLRAVEGPGGEIVTAVTAVGRKAGLGEVFVGSTPWPVQTEGERVAAILAAFPYGSPTFVPEVTNPAKIRARDVDRQNALDLLHEVAASTGSLVWEDTHGEVHYTDAAARAQGTGPHLHLTKWEILAEAAWSQTTGKRVERVEVFYGPEPVSGSVRPSIVGGSGKATTTIQSVLEDRASAEALLALVLARWSQRAWDAPQIMVRADLLPPATWDTLMEVQPGSLISTEGIDGTPAPPQGQTGQWYVEGWVETWEWSEETGLTQVVQYAVSDLARFGASLVWSAVTPGKRWMDVDATQTWAQTLDSIRWAA
jgi:hypothetical protein